MAADRGTLAMFVVTTVLIGFNVVAVKLTVTDIAPMWAAGSRFAIAAALFGLLMWRKRLPVPRGRHLFAVVAFGILDIGVFFALAYWALGHIAAGPAAIILATVPLFTYLLAVLHRVEAASWPRLAGGALAIAGIAVLSGPAALRGGPILPSLALVGAALAAAEATVLLRLADKVAAVTVNALGMGIAAVCLLALSASLGESWRLPSHPETWSAVVYLITIGSLGLFWLFVVLVQRWGPSSSAYVLVMAPIVAAAAGAVVFDEAVTWNMAAASALVALGVYVGAIRPLRTRAAPPAS